MSAAPETSEAARPVLVAVDDEPSVARAVERDLRRRYGRDFRVLRAESGSDALDAVRQSKLRGASVALLLADQRMPGMSGVEFLEEAIGVAPEAKRVLLTAYADTQAAIDAINRPDPDRRPSLVARVARRPRPAGPKPGALPLAGRRAG